MAANTTITDPVTTYSFIKDIGIPVLNLIATIIIGIVIAVMLKRREEKAKIKSLLIDNYMEYLGKRVKFTEQETMIWFHNLLKDMAINYDAYFGRHSNQHFAEEEIQQRRDLFREKLDGSDAESANWSPYTYKFCFLLGTKTYRKKAQHFENVIVKAVLDNNERAKFQAKLKEKVIASELIQKNMNAVNLSQIEHGLDLIEALVFTEYNNYQLKIFQPYDNRIADLIDAK